MFSWRDGTDLDTGENNFFGEENVDFGGAGVLGVHALGGVPQVLPLRPGQEHHMPWVGQGSHWLSAKPGRSGRSLWSVCDSSAGWRENRWTKHLSRGDTLQANISPIVAIASQQQVESGGADQLLQRGRVQRSAKTKEQQSQIFWGKTSSAFTSSTSSSSSSDFVLLPKVDALLKKEVTILESKRCRFNTFQLGIIPFFPLVNSFPFGQKLPGSPNDQWLGSWVGKLS